MPKAIFILGLCGSGKSYIADEIRKTFPAELMDEGFNTDFEKNYKKLVTNLREGKNCIIIEIEFCYKDGLREFIKERLIKDLPKTEIIWKCFENDMDKANQNIINRKNKEDPKGHIEINLRISPKYTFPRDAEILPIITDWK